MVWCALRSDVSKLLLSANLFPLSEYVEFICEQTCETSRATQGSLSPEDWSAGSLFSTACGGGDHRTAELSVIMREPTAPLAGAVAAKEAAAQATALDRKLTRIRQLIDENKVRTTHNARSHNRSGFIFVCTRCCMACDRISWFAA
jgi:hypothetical protein